MEFPEPSIFDKNGEQQTSEWLLSKYGARVRHDFAAQPGQEYWHLKEVRETTGTVIIYVHTQSARGPIMDQPVVLHWPSEDGPPEDLLPSVSFASNWFTRGIAQCTNGNGDTAYAFGADGIIRDLQAGGPYSVWIGSIAKSDMLTRMGWLGGTDHEGPWRLVFELVEFEPVYATLLEALQQTAQKEQRIQFNSDAALQKAIFAAGFVPNSPEYRLEFGGTAYAAQRAEHLATGEVRVYNCPVGLYDQVTFVSGVIE